MNIENDCEDAMAGLNVELAVQTALYETERDERNDLQQRFDTLNANHAEVCATLEAAQARVAELEKELDGARKIINTHYLAIVASIAVGVGSEQVQP